MICQPTGMDIANASMYEGSTAVPEAAMMAVRVTREGVPVARSVHPEYREVIRTYAQHQGLEAIRLCGDDRRHRPGGARTEGRRTDCLRPRSVAEFFRRGPSHSGQAEIVHRKGALLVVLIAEAVSLGVVGPPAEADIVSVESQSFASP